MRMIPYHYIGYSNLKEIYNNSYLNYSEIIEELWKLPEQKKNQMRQNYYIRESTSNDCGWYIYDRMNNKYLHKDLKFHKGTHYETYYGYGESPGYYKSEKHAKYYLQLFLRKTKMENIEIFVSVNGVETPLHKISEQTLLTVRENSRPKEVPVARVGNTPFDNERRLILRVPKNIEHIYAKDEFIVIDLKNGSIQNNYRYDETRKPEDYYKNIQTVS